MVFPIKTQKFMPWDRWDCFIFVVLLIVGYGLRSYLVTTMAAGDTLAGPDSNVYVNTAQSLAYGRGFGTMFWPPLFSFFLIPVYKFGYGLQGAILAQVLLLSLTGGLIYLTARFIFSRVGSLMASVLFLGYSTMLLANSFSILSENLYMPLILMAFLGILLYWQKPSSLTIGRFSIWLGLSAVAFGLTALTRPIVVPFVYLLVGTIWFKERRIFPAVIFVALFFIVIAPWTYRNWRNYHQLTLISNNGAYAFWAGNHYAPKNNWEELPITGKEYPEMPLKSNGWYDERATIKLALSRIVSYPGHFLIATWHRAQTFFPPSEPVYMRNPLSLPIWPFRTILALSMISTVALLFGWKKMSSFERFFWGIIVGYTGFHTLTHLVTIAQDIRYRNVLTPFFVIIAAYPIEQLFRRWRFWPTAIMLIVFMIVTMSLQTEFITDLQGQGLPRWFLWIIGFGGLMGFAYPALSRIKPRLAGITVALVVTFLIVQYTSDTTEQDIKSLPHKRFYQVFISYGVP